MIYNKVFYIVVFKKTCLQNTRDKLDTFSAKFCIFLAQSDWRKNKKIILNKLHSPLWAKRIFFWNLDRKNLVKISFFWPIVENIIHPKYLFCFFFLSLWVKNMRKSMKNVFKVCSKWPIYSLYFKDMSLWDDFSKSNKYYSKNKFSCCSIWKLCSKKICIKFQICWF